MVDFAGVLCPLGLCGSAAAVAAASWARSETHRCWYALAEGRHWTARSNVVCETSGSYAAPRRRGAQVFHGGRVGRCGRTFWYIFRRRTVSLWCVFECVAGDVPVVALVSDLLPCADVVEDVQVLQIVSGSVGTEGSLSCCQTVSSLLFPWELFAHP